MHILLITKTMKPDAGIGRSGKNIFENLKQLGEQVSIITEDEHSVLHVHKGIVSFFRNCLVSRHAAKHASVVHALDAWPYGIYALFAVWGTQKKLFIKAVGTYALPPEKKSLKRALMLKMYKRAQKILCISRYTCQRLQERLPFQFPSDIVHLAAERLPKVERKKAFDRFNINVDHSPIFLTVGEVKERKGQLDTLNGLALLKKEFPDFIYLIVGSSGNSAYVSHIKDRARSLGISKNLRFLDGVKNDTDLALLYSIADVHLLNSNNDNDHFEGFGLVFLEANQFGVPGIGSRGCGIEDAISDGTSGLLVDQKDHVAIAQAARTILHDYKNFQMGACEWSKRFDWGKTARAYQRAYRAVNPDDKLPL